MKARLSTRGVLLLTILVGVQGGAGAADAVLGFTRAPKGFATGAPVPGDGQPQSAIVGAPVAGPGQPQIPLLVAPFPMPILIEPRIVGAPIAYFEPRLGLSIEPSPMTP